MPRIPVHVVRAFTRDGAGGNPAGVVLDADALSSGQRQGVAAAMGLSETAFVGRSDKADVHLEFYTPVSRVPHCGHATVATFFVLAREARITCDTSSKQTIEDVRKIVYRDGLIFMEQKKPSYRDLEAADVAELLPAIGAGPDALHPGAPPSVVSTGNPWLVAPIRGETALRGLVPDHDRIRGMSERLGAVGFYMYALSPDDGATTTREHAIPARMFAPLVGVPEESATGSAAGPLGCYHFDRFGSGRAHLTVHQGQWMEPPSPSRLEIRLNVAEGRVQNLLVGGAAAHEGIREIDLPDGTDP